MAKVGTTRLASDFDPAHTMGCVFDVFDGVGMRAEEAGPSAAGVEFRPAFEQALSAGTAQIFAFAFEVPILTGKGPLGSALAEDVVFLVGELVAPLGLGLLNCILPIHLTIRRKLG